MSIFIIVNATAQTIKILHPAGDQRSMRVVEITTRIVRVIEMTLAEVLASKK